MRKTATLLLGMLALSGVVHRTGGAEAEDSQGPTAIVVIGASGAEPYATQFIEWAQSWEQACKKAGVRSVTLGLEEAPALSDRDALQKTLADESKQTDAPLWLVLIGHGTYDGRTARFNQRDLDLTADDLAAWLKPISRPVAIINTASSSAPFLNKLSAPGRIVITATKSGFEQNFARFGQFMAEAIIDPAADLDKDGQTSLLEAFLTASHQTGEFYAGQGRLATEHALLDDNGDGLGTPADWFRGIRPVQRARDGAELDGYRAGQFCLLYSQAEAEMPPALRAQRDRLELEVMRLRDTREGSSDDEYFARLETLLYEIAKIYEQVDTGDAITDSSTAQTGD